MKKLLESILAVLISLGIIIVVFTLIGSKGTTSENQQNYFTTLSSINYQSILTEEEAYYYNDILYAARSGKVFNKINPCSWLGNVNHEFNCDTAVQSLYMLESDFPLVSCYICQKSQASINITNLWGKYYIYTTPDKTFDASMYDAVEQKANQIADEAWSKSDGNLWDYVDNVYTILSTTTKYAEDNSSVHSNDIYGELIEGSSECLGMSCAFKYILDKHNVPCFIATGTSNEGYGHAWVVIKLNGAWYCGDITNGYKIYSTCGTLNGYVHLIPQNTYLESVTMNESGYRIENSF